MKATNESKAPRELVEKSRNEAYIVTNIYLIVLICLCCISFHYGENPIFNGQPISDKLSAEPSIVVFPTSMFVFAVKIIISRDSSGVLVARQFLHSYAVARELVLKRIELSFVTSIYSRMQIK